MTGGERKQPGLWAHLPIPAIKFLVSIDQRAASRILYAIVLHKGRAESAIFPSYKTLALYACVGENQIRACLDVLEEHKFIKVTKTRVGKKERNEYKILDYAYTLGINPKSKRVQTFGTMICNTCWNAVEGQDISYERSKDWDGNWQENFRHMGCKAVGGYHILIPATESNRWTQAWNKSIQEANETETT
jgi:hypothetical protein